MDCFSAHTTKNPFEDGTDIKDFVEVHYDEVPDKFLQNVDLAKPSNLYKYLLIKIQKLIAEKRSLKKGIKELLKTYKTFMPKDVSFTEIERGRFNAAIATIKLVEMVLCESRLHSNRQPCSCHGITPEIDADKIDLRKLKSICSSLLDILAFSACFSSKDSFRVLSTVCNTNCHAS